MTINRNGRIGTVILGCYLLLVAASLLFGLAVPAIVLGIVAAAAGVCLLFGV